MSGSKLVRSVAGRVRGWLADRRRAPRYKARLPLSVSLGPERGADAAARHLRPVEGYARDISASGIALVLPSARVGDRPLTVERELLQVRLPVKPRGITISVVPVRSVPLEAGGEDEETGAYVVGARIAGMDEGDRALLARHLERLRLRVKDYAP